MKYKALIPQANERPIQVFSSTLEGIKALAKQYLNLLPPGKTATILAIREVPVLEIVSVEADSKFTFTERNIENEQAAS